MWWFLSLQLLSLIASARPDILHGNSERRNSVVKLRFIRRPILPFNITFRVAKDSFENSFDDAIILSIESFLQASYEEAFRSFHHFELEEFPASVAVGWASTRFDVSINGNFAFVSSSVIPSSVELHGLEKSLLNTYRKKFQDFVRFNGIFVELEAIDFDDNIFFPAVDERTMTRKRKKIPAAYEEFFSSRKFIIGVSVTVVLSMLVCLCCVCRLTNKVAKKRDRMNLKMARRRETSFTSRYSSGMTSSYFFGPENEIQEVM